MSDQPTDRLEAAKERLKNALNRLEKVLDKRLRDAEVRVARAETSAQALKNPQEMKALAADLDALKRQLAHAEEEGETLRQQLGEEHELLDRLKKAHAEVSARVEGVIVNIQEILENQGV